MKLMEAKKIIAESLGTFTLAFAVLLSATATNFPVPVPVIAGLTLGLFVYTIGSISGCHLNPAVTLGLLSIKKIKPRESFMYIVAQLVGALFALFSVVVLGIQIPAQSNIFLIDPIIMAGEIIGTTILTFGIASVVFGKISDGAAGAVIGGSLALGAFIAGIIGAPGYLNPAVALAFESLSISTLVAPIIGGILGMQIYKFLVSKN